MTAPPRLGTRLRIGGAALAVAAASFLAPVGPGAPAPAGAFGVAPSGAIGCNAQGFSGLWGNWIGLTSGSNCGPNYVRFRYWGTLGPWVKKTTPTGAVVTTPNNFLLGGADHKACYGCRIVST